jgi:integrase/recombinase XerD
MIDKLFRWPRACAQVLSSPAGPYLDDLATILVRQGFGRWKVRQRLHGAAHFSLFSAMVGVSLEGLHEDLFPAFRAHLRRCRCPGRLRRGRSADVCTVAGARALVEHLRHIAVVQSPVPVPTPADVPPLVQRFHTWMQQQRGLPDATLRNYERVIGDALHALGRVPRDYTAASIREYVIKSTAGQSRGHGKCILTAMRHFLRFLIADGTCRPGLDGAVPTIAMWRLSALPRYLPAADVDRLLAVCDRATPLGLRDRAVLLLLVRLGLRAGDIRALAIGDVDWQQASVRVAGKSRTHVRLPLTQEVGDALVDYLTRGRPPAETDRVFLRVLAPWRPLTVSAVSRVVDRAMARAGVTAPCRGAHVLRHSAATEMLRQGATLDQIGAVLRHRYMDTTAHYAKVDVLCLRAIALPWPEVMPC